MKPSTRARWQALAALEGLIPESTGMTLATLAAEVPEHLAIVELGSYKGRSTAYLAEGARLGLGARVVAVDAWSKEGNPTGRHGYADPETRRTFTQQLRAVDLRDRVKARTGFSVDVAAKWRDGPVGLLFIDADHEYESVIGDFYAWLPHLASGATVVFDDYKTERNPGVAIACREIRAHGKLVDWVFEPKPLAIGRVP